MLVDLISTDLLMGLCMVLAFMAVAAVTKVIGARRQARKFGRLARSRARSMRELLSTVRMAETIAGIGVWQYDPATGVQEWSDGLRRLFGVEHHDDFVEGDAETLLFANNIDLLERVRLHSEETEPFTLQFELAGSEGAPRALAVQACNLRDGEGRIDRVVAVVRDNTDQMRQLRELQSSRERARSEAEQARTLAETDPLTGLANRRRVMSEIDRLVLSARVSQMPLVLVLFDIDHFKLVNDTHGHPAGDAVLRRVARIAEAQAREGDLVGRVGGEEFVWAIPCAADSMARAMTERLRDAVARGSSVGGVPPVTISLGYTSLQAGDTALTMFSRADQALYAAKHSGRNQVKMAA